MKKIPFFSYPLALTSLIFLSTFFLMAIIGPFLTPYSYHETHLDLKNLAPSFQFWFGTDELGRDLFTRTWWGARISLTVGISAALIDMIIGVFVGSVAAFFGGKIDEILMRLCDILHSLPYLLIVILLMVIMGPGIGTILIALTITGWINMARIVRGQVLSLKEREFVKASYVLGASSFRILFIHIIPNVSSTILVTMMLTIPSAMFAEAFLSFLGLGVQAPIASWGVMMNDGLSALRYYPWRLFFPAICITCTMVAFHLLSESIREFLEPRKAL
ncbi:MAG: ABC transporter permease [Chlamydiota bacterium]